MIKNMILVVALFSSLQLLAHEGHEDAPGALKANHGGVVQAGKELNLEYVVSGTEVKLFPIAHDGKEIAAAHIKLTATTQLPKAKPEAVNLEAKDGAFIARVDFKKAYRIEMKVEAMTQGKKSSFKFQVEK